MDSQIFQVQMMFEKYNFPPISDNYFKNVKKLKPLDPRTEDLLLEIPNKMETILDLKNLKFVHSYFPENPFDY